MFVLRLRVRGFVLEEPYMRLPLPRIPTDLRSIGLRVGVNKRFKAFLGFFLSSFFRLRCKPSTKDHMGQENLALLRTSACREEKRSKKPDPSHHRLSRANMVRTILNATISKRQPRKEKSTCNIVACAGRSPMLDDHKSPQHAIGLTTQSLQLMLNQS